ncbi:MAG: hypothetical protein J6A69_09210 [Clostridia bacterium]|nr:hypothetical protein [Clostridia bacterium]
MSHNEKTRDLLTAHYKKYPNLQIRDLFKYIYQSSFGCEHMVSSLVSATGHIEKERENISSTEILIEPLDGEYSRVHLTSKNSGLSSKTLGHLFFKSAKKETHGITALKNKLSVARELICTNKLPFSLNEFDIAVQEWENSNFNSVHHSETFRDKYSPSYRVIANEYVTFLSFFAQLDNMNYNKMNIVAIEGGSASGKTTLSKILEEIYDCTIIHMDDFFLRPEQRTKERYAEIGGNIDKERFLTEVLIPLSNNETLNYRKFDCSTFTLTAPVKVVPKNLVIIEGAYSMHPWFTKYYDFSVFLDISSSFQRERIRNRNSNEMAERFYNEWIPLEQRYFSETKIRKRCNMTISIHKQKRV